MEMLSDGMNERTFEELYGLFRIKNFAVSKRDYKAVGLKSVSQIPLHVQNVLSDHQTH